MMNTSEKRKMIDAFVKSMCSSAFHALNAKDGLEIGLPSKEQLERCSKEFKNTMWIYNQLMEMADVPEVPATPVVECIPPVHEFGNIQLSGD